MGIGGHPRDVDVDSISRNVADKGYKWLVYHDGTNTIGVDTDSATVEYEADAQTTIQGILDTVSSGERVHFRGGHQYGNVNLTLSTNDVVLTGEERRHTELYNTGTSPPLTIAADWCQVRNLGFNGFGSNSPTAGLEIADSSTNNVVENSRVRNVNANPGVVVKAYGNRFEGLHVLNCAGGVHLTAGANTEPNDVKFYGGRLYTNKDSQNLFVVDSGDGAYLNGVTFESAGTGNVGIDLNTTDPNGFAAIHRCRFETLDTGIDAGDSSGTNQNHNAIGCLFTGDVTTPINDPNAVVTESHTL